MKSLVFIIVLALSPACYCSPYNEKDAFCRDKSYGYTSNYTRAKIYNNCMRNADALIYEYEQEQRRRRIEWQRGEPERKKQSEKIEREQKQQELEAKKREQQRKSEEYKKKLEEENEKRRIDYLFKTKFN